ncbi:flavin reductase family protein [Alkalicoccobacillus porphyridii]|uniref:Flavin reductase n=1 Tax=Alkalicoccobacillus porphyridii TaxID=2597270 RepID=A0A554A0N4_9BACI|nr:flavin reductase family protein [Alkalicoccobacillus porphyridii]TSB47233.1 flavin reductase [Alkalicoccobacillus porphyridii]
MRTPTEKPGWHTYPGMVAIVTSKHEDQCNVMAAGWHTYIGQNPGYYGISLRKETYSFKLIQESRTFGVNFLTGTHSEWIQASGTYSGSVTDKFKTLDIPYERGIKVDVPILLDAYFAYECKVVDITTYGDHEWIVGEVMLTYQDKNLFSENGLPDLAKISIPTYLGRSEYRMINEHTDGKTHRIQRL